MRHISVPSFLINALLIAITGAGLFVIKYKVQNINKQIRSIDAEIVAHESSIHIMNAEWAYLTQPSKISKLAENHLDLREITPQDVKVISLEEK